MGDMYWQLMEVVGTCFYSFAVYIVAHFNPYLMLFNNNLPANAYLLALTLFRYISDCEMYLENESS
jgi:hypothetical protein